MLTAYDATMGALFDQAVVDLLLVGCSLATRHSRIGINPSPYR